MNFFYPNIDSHKNRIFNAIFCALILHIALIYYINYNKTNHIYSDLNQPLSKMVSLNFSKLKILEQKSEVKQINNPDIANNNLQDISAAKISTDNVAVVTTEIKLKGKQIPPQYPSRALRLGQEGKVLIKVFLAEDGSQIEREIINSSGFVLLDKAALKAIKKWDFLPYKTSGKNRKAYIHIPVEFKIS